MIPTTSPHSTSSKQSLAAALLLFILLLFTLLRIALLAVTGSEQIPLSSWPVVLFKGLWFDAVVASALLAPVLLYEAVLPNRWRVSRLHRSLRTLWLFFSVALLLFGAVSEFTFWIEFSSRLNFIALDYLLYTSEVIGNIRQSYPVNSILAAIGVVAATLTWWIRHRSSSVSLTLRQRLVMATLAVTAPTALLSVSSIDQMEGLKNAYADELSGNGLFTLAAAARRNELDYPKFYRMRPSAAVAKTLEGMGVARLHAASVQLANLHTEGARSSPYFKRVPKNLVLVSVESLSASFLGSYGSAEQLTPELDALARDGLLFTQVYATGTRTVRGLEALSLGTPPMPGQAIVRRLNNMHLATLGEVLEHQGFEPFFFYGGYGYFDNMNAYFSANDYRVIDRTDIPTDRILFENVWGVADEVLFDRVIEQLDQRRTSDKPFFAHVMTTSNHRPYTYPDGRIDIPSPGGRRGAVKYTDYAIGDFVRKARNKPWFRDTLFVFVADHCASVAGKTKLPVANYRIPLIMYAPGMLKPGRYQPMLSQIDIVPSLVDALGKAGKQLFYGRSAFEPGPPMERAFISNYQELGYLRKGKLTVLLPKRRVETFDIDAKTLEATPAPVDPQLLDEAIAYYQSASEEFRTGHLVAPFYLSAATAKSRQ